MVKTEPHTCYSCGNTGVMKLIGSLDNPEIIHEEDDFGNVLCHQEIEDTRWFLFQCPVCNNPVLISEYTCAGMPDNYCDVKIEFPTFDVKFDGVPEKIQTAFESAIKTKGIDKAICLLSLRRTLETICKDKLANGKDLEAKINYLISEKVLPEMMNDACWIIRQCGNDAAHADNVDFSDHEVTECIQYISTVIYYLYSMPVRVAVLKEKIEKRKADKKE